MHPSTVAKRGTVLLFLAFIAFYLYGLGHLPLLGPDEPRYAQVAREMFLRHDLVTPTLAGHLWFEKPALLYWLMIGSFKLFGVSEWTTRLGPAVCGLLTIVAVWWIGRRVERVSSDEGLGAFGFWSALAAGTMIGILVFARGASFDIVVTMTTSWALAFFIGAEIEESAQRRLRLLAGFYVFVGLSLLAKGLVGIVVPFGVVGTYYLLSFRLPSRSVVFSFIWGLPLAIAVAATWYAPVISKHGWLFIDQFFIQHHFARYLTDKYHHPAPFYYYLLVFIPLTLPWTAFVIEGILKAGKLLWRRDSLRLAPEYKFRVFTIAWLLLPLLFFSLSGSKLPGYILPIFPAAALLAGERLSQLSVRPGGSRWAVRITASVCLLVAVAIVVGVERSASLPLRSAVLIVIPMVAAGGFGLVWARRGATFAMIISGATLATALITLNFGAQKLAEGESTRDLFQLADARGYSQSEVFGLQRNDRTPEFYAAGRVAYEANGEAVMYESVGQVVEESRRRRATVLALVPLDQVEQFIKLAAVPVEVIGNNGRVALLAVGP